MLTRLNEKKKHATRADVFFITLVKSEIKIKNNVNYVKKVLQNVHKYPKNNVVLTNVRRLISIGRRFDEISLNKVSKVKKVLQNGLFVSAIVFIISVLQNVKKVLLNGYKYPQNSTMSLFLLHILILILNTLILNLLTISSPSGFGGLFTFVFTKCLQNRLQNRFCSCPRSCSVIVVVEPSQLVRLLLCLHPFLLCKMVLKNHLQNCLQNHFLLYKMVLKACSCSRSCSVVQVSTPVCQSGSQSVCNRNRYRNRSRNHNCNRAAMVLKACSCLRSCSVVVEPSQVKKSCNMFVSIPVRQSVSQFVIVVVIVIELQYVCKYPSSSVRQSVSQSVCNRNRNHSRNRSRTNLRQSRDLSCSRIILPISSYNKTNMYPCSSRTNLSVSTYDRT